MMLRYPSPALRQCSNRVRTTPSSATTATASSYHQAPKNDTIATQQQHHSRQFSSLPHHLSRQNNGMVNIFVKSTKVPRPSLPKTFNQLKPLSLREEEVVTIGKEEAQHVPSHFSYAGNIRMPITSEMNIVMPGEDTPSGIWPVFRMMVSIEPWFVLFWREIFYHDDSFVSSHSLHPTLSFINYINFTHARTGWKWQLSSTR